MMSVEYRVHEEPGAAIRVGGIKIGICDNPERIWLDREGEGGEFSLREFLDMLHVFISERL